MSLVFVMRLGFGHPFEPARVRLGGIAAHDENQIGILMSTQ